VAAVDRRGPGWPAIAAGLLASFVGFASSFAVVLRGLTEAGASPAQAASGLMAVSVAMGIGGIWLSWRTRMPVSVAWSTPGAALLASTGVPEGGFPVAVGASLAAGVLMVAAGLIRPLGRAVAAIPAPLANAMLAGVLLNLCLAPVRAVAFSPAMGLAILGTWAVVARFNRLLAVPAAVVVTAVLVAATTPLPFDGIAALLPTPVLVMPQFSPVALLGIALPLFVVTMASQNIPGIAVLHANGYRPDPGPLFTRTGILTLLGAPLGGHAVNLAAITAAICAGPEADPDPARRWWAAVVAGLGYIAFGLMAGGATVLIAAAPPVLIEAAAGLALLGAFSGALMAAVADPARREAAAITFLVSASGLAFAGIGGAFWGLLAGIAMLGLARIGR
jgi:benzoate membrane transport protein